MKGPAGATTRRCNWRSAAAVHVGDGAEPLRLRSRIVGQSPRGGVCRGRDAEARGPLPQDNQIGDERGSLARLARARCRAQGTRPRYNQTATRARWPRGGGWEGRAAEARVPQPRVQPAFSDGKGRVEGGRGQEDGLVCSSLVAKLTQLGPTHFVVDGERST